MLADLLKDIGTSRFSAIGPRLRRGRHVSAQAEPRLRQLFEHCADAIFVVEVLPERQFRFELLNPAASIALKPVTAGDIAFHAIAPDVPVPKDICIHLHRCLRTCLPVKYEGRLGAMPPLYDINLIPLADDAGISRIFGFARAILPRHDTGHDLIATEAQLRALAARRAAERDAERKRIAHEMHEELGQVLAMLRMHIAVSRTAASPVQLHHHWLPMLDDAIHMVRSIASTLRPKVLEMGLVQALQWLADEFRVYSGIDYRLHLQEEDDFACLGEDHARILFHAAQECLDNVAQHAEATLVEISLERQDKYHRLEVKDNGKGFDLGARIDSALGLADIREHLLSLGGRLLLWSAPGQGTRVTAYIPFKEQLNKGLHDSYLAG